MLPYLGFGAGAHGFANGIHTANVLAPAAYIQRMSDGSPLSFPRTPAAATVTEIDPVTEMGEVMMMGLRLVQEGISRLNFQERFGQTLQQAYGKQIDRLVRLGLLEWAGDGQEILRLTSHGRLLGNQVFMEFI
jgi:oxygen-independent coproporphyrinogen-3 oxidase